MSDASRYSQNNHRNYNPRNEVLLLQYHPTPSYSIISDVTKYPATPRNNRMKSLRERYNIEATENYMKLFYYRTKSERTSTSWINSLIKLNLELYLSEWKNYCNLIHEVSPKDSNTQSQLHQDMVPQTNNPNGSQKIWQNFQSWIQTH